MPAWLLTLGAALLSGLATWALSELRQRQLRQQVRLAAEAGVKKLPAERLKDITAGDVSSLMLKEIDLGRYGKGTLQLYGPIVVFLVVGLGLYLFDRAVEDMPFRRYEVWRINVGSWSVDGTSGRRGIAIPYLDIQPPVAPTGAGFDLGPLLVEKGDGVTLQATSGESRYGPVILRPGDGLDKGTKDKDGFLVYTMTKALDLVRDTTAIRTSVGTLAIPSKPQEGDSGK